MNKKQKLGVRLLCWILAGAMLISVVTTVIYALLGML